MYSGRFLHHNIRCRSQKCRQVFRKQHHVRFPKVVKSRALDKIWHARTKASELYFHSEESSRLARAENMIREDSMLLDLWSNNSPIRQQASYLLDKEVELYKDKLLIKWPKMKGFRAHQDIVAYDPMHEYITARIALDNVSIDQGPIEFATEWPHSKYWNTQSILPVNSENGCISANVLPNLKFEPQEIKAGDILFFSGYLPHQSGENYSHNAHVALYLTFSTMPSGANYYYITRSTKMQEQARWIREAKRLRNIQQENRSSLIGHSRDNLMQNTRRNMSYFTFRDIDDYVDTVYDDLTIIYRSEGHNQYDPNITHLQHALTSAYMATQYGKNGQQKILNVDVSLENMQIERDDMVVACLLHDIGHLIVREHRHQDNFLEKDKRHELIGANYLRRHGFPPSVYMPVQQHVQAKRAMQTLLFTDEAVMVLLHFMKIGYLTEEEFAEMMKFFAISETSEQSWHLQGGRMSQEEIHNYFNMKWAWPSILLRGLENISKLTDLKPDDIPKWHNYEQTLKSVLRKHLLEQYRIE